MNPADGAVPYRPDLLELAAGFAEDSVMVTTAQLDAPGPQILYVNSAFTRMMGYSAAELLGQTPRMFQGPKTDRATLDRLKSDLLAGRDFTGRTINYRRNGEEFVLEWIISHIRDADGRTTHFVAIQRDITGRDQAAELLVLRDQELQQTSAELFRSMQKLESAERQVVDQERLAALGQMASGVVHDLSNSLTPIQSVVDLLKMTEGLPEVVRDGLEAIQASARHMTALVNNLRRFSAPPIDTGAKDRIDLKQILQEIPEITRAKWQVAARAAGAAIAFELQLTDVPQVVGNPVDLRQMLVNLVFNAVDAMPEGGTIAMRLKSVKDKVLIEVEDSGQGLTDESVERCFEPYYTNKEQGTGLGLSVCYGIAKRHGGDIIAERSGSGRTLFRISLPTAEAAAPPETIPDKLRLLYIDDNEDARKSLSFLIRAMGHEVDLAENGDAGLSMFYAKRYDCVVTDLMMLPTSGIEVTRAIKRAGGQAPVVVMSGDSSERIAAKFPMHLKPDAILEKPFTQEQLQATLRRIIH